MKDLGKQARTDLKVVIIEHLRDKNETLSDELRQTKQDLRTEIRESMQNLDNKMYILHDARNFNISAEFARTRMIVVLCKFYLYL
jgi:hypothetical protein